MTTLHDPFPDIERALVLGLPALVVVSNGGTLTVAPDFTPSQEPTGSNAHIRVELIDSPDDDFTALNVVNIDVFAASRAVGYAVAEQVRGIVKSARSIGGVVIDRTQTVSGPKQVPWDDNTTIRRFLATYRIPTRRQ
jgi:hypothetical protein